MKLADDVSAFFDAIDVASARGRAYMRTVVAVGMTLQGLIAAGAIKVAPGSKWDRLASILTALVAYFTVHNPDYHSAAIEKRRTVEAMAAVAPPEKG